MEERYFENNLPDYGEGSPEVDASYFLAHALDLKNKIVEITWLRHGKVKDPTLYVGVLGTAFMLFRSYETTGSLDDLGVCLDIIDSCASSVESHKKYVTFIIGRAGVYALGAAAAKYAENPQKVRSYVELLKKMAKEKELLHDVRMPDELLYGRTGFLWACLFVNKYIGEETIPSSITEPILATVLSAGRAGAHSGSSPLMYQWMGTRYWGAAHGLAGIMHVLMHFPLSDKDAQDVKDTLLYMVTNGFPSGNYPTVEGDKIDTLVHWCHGAPGVGLTLCKAAQVFPSEAFAEAAVRAGEVVWTRGLLKRVGICHGISGNAYTFLALHRLTGDNRYLHRAVCFSKFLCEFGLIYIASGKMHGGDHPHSLFEGLAGLVCLLLDMGRPENARFPAYEL